MGKMIGSTAEVGRIEEHVRASYRAALARGEAIGEAAKARLQQAVATIDSTLAADKQAAAVEADTWAVVLAEAAKSDLIIGSVRDAMWNALGRPRLTTLLDQVFPEGVATYTSSDPKMKPMLMQVLVARILSATAPSFTKERKDGWVAQLESRRNAFQEAVDAHRPIEAAATVAHIGYRGAVRTALARLRDFKRDLRSLGLDQAAIGEIIPSDHRSPREVTPAPPAVPNVPVVRAA